MNNSAKIALVTGGAAAAWDARPSKRWHSAA